MWHARRRPLHLRTSVGVVELRVWHGYDPGAAHWGCPIRQHWGLTPHQQSSPLLEDKLAFTVTATGSYEQAAAVATRWGCPADDTTLHALAQRLGARAEAHTQQRLAQPPPTVAVPAPPSALAVMMLDGWQTRQRGPGWGKKKTRHPRVEWHELKTGVYYRHEQAGQTAGGRGVLTEKAVVSWQGEPLELGRRLHAEALRRGLASARQRVVVADGAPWIWNVVADRWRGATEVLDFYHMSQHLWVEPRLHQMRHGAEPSVLAEIAGWTAPRGERGKTIKREQHYFATHAKRMPYQALSRRGWPIGSGAVESACRQRQGRCKRPGQFWTARGLRHLCALEEARHNNHWDQLWLAN